MIRERKGGGTNTNGTLARKKLREMTEIKKQQHITLNSSEWLLFFPYTVVG